MRELIGRESVYKVHIRILNIHRDNESKTKGF